MDNEIDILLYALRTEQKIKSEKFKVSLNTFISNVFDELDESLYRKSQIALSLLGTQILDDLETIVAFLSSFLNLPIDYFKDYASIRSVVAQAAHELANKGSNKMAIPHIPTEFLTAWLEKHQLGSLVSTNPINCKTSLKI